MKISIASLRNVIDNIDYIKRSNLNLISIRDSNDNPLYDIIDNAGLKNLLAITFDDLTDWVDRVERPPTEDDIKTILEWAKQKMTENSNDFIVQCTAGISRSSAVAILVQYLQDPTKALKVINPILHSPNEKILEIGDKLLNSKLKEPTKELLKKHDEEFINNVGKDGKIF